MANTAQQVSDCMISLTPQNAGVNEGTCSTMCAASLVILDTNTSRQGTVMMQSNFLVAGGLKAANTWIMSERVKRVTPECWHHSSHKWPARSSQQDQSRTLLQEVSPAALRTTMKHSMKIVPAPAIACLLRA